MSDKTCGTCDYWTRARRYRFGICEKRCMTVCSSSRSEHSKACREYEERNDNVEQVALDMLADIRVDERYSGETSAEGYAERLRALGVLP